MSSSGAAGGFMLVETLVALLVGVALVVAIGILGNGLIRHRVNADSNSAATSLAQLKLERLKTLEEDDSDLTSGSHSAGSVFEDGLNGVGAPYLLTWQVTNDVPWTGSKKVVVTVVHQNNPFARAELQTYVLPRDFVPGGA